MQFFDLVLPLGCEKLQAIDQQQTWEYDGVVLADGEYKATVAQSSSKVEGEKAWVANYEKCGINGGQSPVDIRKVVITGGDATQLIPSLSPVKVNLLHGRHSLSVRVLEGDGDSDNFFMLGNERY